MSRPAIAFLIACIGIALFSAMDAAMKAVSIAIGAYNAMLWRTLTGSLIAVGPWLVDARGHRPSRATMRIHWTRGVVAAFMATSFFYGITRIPLAEGIALSFIAPIIALYLAAVLLGERIGRATIAASVLGLMGVGVILAGRMWASEAGAPRHFDGVAAILFSAVLYAWNLVLMRQQALASRPAEGTFFQSAVSFATLAIAAPWLAVAPPPALYPLILLSAALTFTSLMLMQWAYARAPANVLVPVEYTAFVWAAIMGAAFFGEAVGWPTVAGAVLIVGGCLIAAFGARGR